MVSLHVCERCGLLMFLRLCSRKLPERRLTSLVGGPLRFALTSQASLHFYFMFSKTGSFRSTYNFFF